MVNAQHRLWNGRCFVGNLNQHYINSVTGDITTRCYSDLYDEYYYLDSSHMIAQRSFGKKDKNGKTIFEGDILKVPTGFLLKPFVYLEVGFRDAAYVAVGTREHEDDDLRNYHFVSKNIPWGVSTVAGNILENPDLVNPDFLSKDWRKDLQKKS